MRWADLEHPLARFWPKIGPNHRFDYRHSGAKTAIIPNPLVLEASVRAFTGARRVLRGFAVHNEG